MLGGHLITSHRMQLIQRTFGFVILGEKNGLEVTRFGEILLLEIVIFKQ
jgi:hypothetical protein